jgi:hypothetical protein
MPQTVPQNLPITIEKPLVGRRVSFDMSPSFNFETGDFNMINGNFDLALDVDNLIQWIHKALITERYKYPIYTWQFGNDLLRLIGNATLVNSIHAVIAYRIRDVLLSDNRIVDVRNIATRIEDGSIIAKFVVVTNKDIININPINISPSFGV